MELTCEKYQEKKSENNGCLHQDEYCKHRTSCMIHFMSGELELSGKDGGSERGDDGQARLGERYMIELRFDKGNGLLPAIAQDYRTNEVLMLAYFNEEAWRKTLETGKAHYWSRSRNKLWLKGESSGHVQIIKEILVDCDEDTVIFKVEQLGGAACHKGYSSCFFRRVEGGRLKVIGEMVFDPDEVYKK